MSIWRIAKQYRTSNIRVFNQVTALKHCVLQTMLDDVVDRLTEEMLLDVKSRIDEFLIYNVKECSPKEYGIEARYYLLSEVQMRQFVDAAVAEAKVETLKLLKDLDPLLKEKG